MDSCLGNVHSMVRAAGVSAGKLQNHGDVLLYGTSQFLYQIFGLSLFSISKTWSCEVGISLSTTTILFATWKIQQRLFLILYFHAIIEFLLCHQSLVNITIFIASHIYLSLVALMRENNNILTSSACKYLQCGQYALWCRTNTVCCSIFSVLAWRQPD